MRRALSACWLAVVMSPVLSLADPSPTARAPEQTDVFVSGQDGYHTYRIPAAIVTTKGTLLVFCEGRKTSRSDTGDIDMLLKRSVDGGKTFSDAQVIWDDGPNTCGNPCPVVDENTGHIWLLMTQNPGDTSERKIVAGQGDGTRTVWVTHSTDDGRTWADPTEITKDVKRPNWTWYATGPGVGIQLKLGPHRGRLVIPCDYIGPPGEPPVVGSHVICSDDHGRTWQLGGTVSDQTNECQIIERTNGSLLLNMRWWRPTKMQHRNVATSTDGGVTWSKARQDETLISPCCQGSLIRHNASDSATPPIVLFSNPAHISKRLKMTVRISYDEGASWPTSRLLWAGPTAYSCLAMLQNGDIGCLYERGEKQPYEKITFARFDLPWLTEPAAGNPSATPPTRLIFDTDMGNDIDDALALGVIHALQSRNECELLAVTLSKDNPHSGPFVDLVNTFYGRGDIPIGVVRDGKTPADSKYTTPLCQARDGKAQRYPHDLTDGTNAPEAVGLLREVLARQPDHSVAFAVVGFSTNIARLLNSKPDHHSSLSGVELVRAKCSLLSIMAGIFNEGEAHKEYNIVKDIPAAQEVFAKWPTPVIVSGFEIGRAIEYPAVSIEQDFGYVAHHPLAEGYRAYMKMPYDRPTWDLTSVLHAVRPDRGYFSLSQPGIVSVDEQGLTTHTLTPDGRHRYLTVDAGQIAQVRESLVQLTSQPPDPEPAAALPFESQFARLQAALKGKRVGLLTNPTGVDCQYNLLADRLHADPEIQLVCFFAPEHGLRDDRQAGVKIDDYIDETTGLPVYSVYGPRKAPEPAHLTQLDALVCDMQDVGARFYTRIWNMARAMEATARADKEFIVFDRPNPIGLDRMEGPPITFNAGLIGTVWPGEPFGVPTRHGMTVGEVLNLVNEEWAKPKAKLTVIKIPGYTRKMTFEETGYPWVMPSPNMPTIDTAMVYTGTCVFEGTNLSEGRGTTRPFELIGAPFVDGPALVKRLNASGLKGVRFRPAWFTPTFDDHEKQRCSGVQLHVMDRASFEPVRTGLTLLKIICDMYPEDVVITSFASRLTGIPDLDKTIRTASVDDLVESWQGNLEAFAANRRPHLLYR